ncbi:MAG: LysM peptidoglycan-binding domain-containing protein [Candidatus Marinimicrobia bacterium]|jgi:membrane-bound lytic murein transglycosylase D|nr:LysM peptidoglycan-binding domain-containing protein [Candidatus Neomarinimicrobiota bacterium]MDP6936803.1 LysM peptidoglycan-binding domain-containing protein [Candidatus Neomarinimicrobiota bacterium]
MTTLFSTLYTYILLFSIVIAEDSLTTLKIADMPDSTGLTVTPVPHHHHPTTEDIFDAQMAEAKAIYAEAVISDLTGDTLEAAYQFELLFESLAHIEELTVEDEFQTLEFNRLLTASIDYYEDESVTLSQVETGFSVAVLKDKLNEYIYDQKLDELEYVEERVEIIPGHVPITYNQKVASIIKFFQNQGRNSFQKWLNRMSRFKPIILPILEEEEVPPELFYLAMIESGLNPKAYSYAHASGVWQFIASTGKIYGLKKNWWIDERRDYEKATRAAARYLKDLHEEFDDWYLAFAAYNCGEARVRKTIKRQGTRDYWQLTRLPAQTRNYVPNIMAALFIANDPEKYGFALVEDGKMEWRRVEIDKAVSLEIIADISGVDVGVLQEYNPELKQGTIPPLEEGKVYAFRLPITASENFDSLLAAVEVEKVQEVVFLDHKVKRGESLWLIARKYDVRIQDIVAINKLARAKYIRPGQVLQIPADGYDLYRKSAMAKSASSKQIYYTVRYGDTLSAIAMTYRTSVKKIKKWNGLRSDRIYTGQKLKIWTKA